MSNEEKYISILEEILETMSDRISNLTEWANVLSDRITNTNERISILTEDSYDRK